MTIVVKHDILCNNETLQDGLNTMMGKSHLILGAAGWLTIGVPAVELLTGTPLGAAEIASGTVVSSGAAMLPDLDHPQATVSRTFGKVSQTFAKYFAKAMGGHRNGSHSAFFAAAIFFCLQYFFSHMENPVWLATGVTIFAASLLFKVLTDSSGVVGFILASIVGATILSVTANSNYDWIIYAVTVGILLHDLGDILTVEGVPLFYPFSKHRLSIPLVGRTDSWREHATSIVCAVVAVFCLYQNVYAPIWDGQKVSVGDGIGKALAKTGNDARKAVGDNPKNIINEAKPATNNSTVQSAKSIAESAVNRHPAVQAGAVKEHSN